MSSAKQELAKQNTDLNRTNRKLRSRLKRFRVLDDDVDDDGGSSGSTLSSPADTDKHVSPDDEGTRAHIAADQSLSAIATSEGGANRNTKNNASNAFSRTSDQQASPVDIK